ncbi:hypothetical protein BD310DRAFT_971399 [Dichomitus squalens]|uniref:Uncharacterized protein n=1 Tax=Dichomitus squalens TaxID=114155 RepID=A0A4Q9PFK9_9APHY|nr:hypothetical protein BD310DRAFT_971399 [Dichomitus squalens]
MQAQREPMIELSARSTPCAVDLLAELECARRPRPPKEDQDGEKATRRTTTRSGRGAGRNRPVPTSSLATRPISVPVVSPRLSAIAVVFASARAHAKRVPVLPVVLHDPELEPYAWASRRRSPGRCLPHAQLICTVSTVSERASPWPLRTDWTVRTTRSSPPAAPLVPVVRMFDGGGPPGEHGDMTKHGPARWSLYVQHPSVPDADAHAAADNQVARTAAGSPCCTSTAAEAIPTRHPSLRAYTVGDVARWLQQQVPAAPVGAGTLKHRRRSGGT